MKSSIAIFKFRFALGIFIFGLVVSGLTAFPLFTELKILVKILGLENASSPEGYSGLDYWILTISFGLENIYRAYPWVGYGTDWLAFGHLVIALFFISPFLKPLESRSVLIVGLIACIGVIPLAMICGAIREIPFYWRLIDCSFGIFGALPLLYCLYLLKFIDNASNQN